jgi:hypothetical protein
MNISVFNAIYRFRKIELNILEDRKKRKDLADLKILYKRKTKKLRISFKYYLTDTCMGKVCSSNQEATILYFHTKSPLITRLEFH